MPIKAVVVDRAALVKERPGEEVLFEILHPIGVAGTKENYLKAQEASRAFWRENYKEKPKGQRWSKEVRRECLGAAVFALQTQQDLQEVVDRLDQFWDAFRLQDLQAGARACLQALLGARLPMGLLAQSLRSSNEIRFELERLGIGRYFFRVVSSEDVEFDKPDLRIFNLMAEKMGCIPTEIAYLGAQSEEDALGALDAGLTPVMLSRKDHPPHPGVHYVHSLVEVPGLIASLDHAPGDAPAGPHRP
jgi:FMN phosphatase YigB (HAD superfamily)